MHRSGTHITEDPENTAVNVPNPILHNLNHIDLDDGGQASGENNSERDSQDIEEGHNEDYVVNEEKNPESEDEIVKKLQKIHWKIEFLVFACSASFQVFQIYRLLRLDPSRYFIDEFSDIPETLEPLEDLTAWSLQSCLWGMLLPSAIARLLTELANLWQGIAWDQVPAVKFSKFKKIEHKGLIAILGFMLAAYPPMCLTILMAFKKTNNLFLISGEVPPNQWGLPTQGMGITTTPSIDEMNVGFPYALAWVPVQLMFGAGVSVKNAIFLRTTPTLDSMKEPRIQRIIDAVSFSIVGLMAIFPLLVIGYFAVPTGEVTWLSYAATLQDRPNLYNFLKNNFSFESMNQGMGELCVNSSTISNFSAAGNGTEICITDMKIDPFAGFAHRWHCIPGSLLGQSTVPASWTFSGSFNGSEISGHQTEIASFEICNTAEELAGLELTVCYALLGVMFYMALAGSFCSEDGRVSQKVNNVYDKLVDDIRQHKIKVFVFLFLIFGVMTDILAPVNDAEHRLAVAWSGVKPLFFAQADQGEDIFSIALLVSVVWFTFDVIVWGSCMWHAWKEFEGASALQSCRQTLYDRTTAVVSAGCTAITTCCETVMEYGRSLRGSIMDARSSLFGVSLHESTVLPPNINSDPVIIRPDPQGTHVI